MFVPCHSEELLVWSSHLLHVADSETVVTLFVTCVSQLVVSASDYIDRTLDAVSQAAAAVKQSTHESVEWLPSVGRVNIEGLSTFLLTGNNILVTKTKMIVTS